MLRQRLWKIWSGKPGTLKTATLGRKLSSQAVAERLACVDRKDFDSFYRLNDRVVLGFTRKLWFSIKKKPILYFKGLSFGYFSANRYATDRVTGCSSCVIYFICPYVSSFAENNRSWFFAQRYQLRITITTITRDALFYGGNLFNINKMFSHSVFRTREKASLGFVVRSRGNIQYAN